MKSPASQPGFKILGGRRYDALVSAMIQAL